ncbi:MAG TPA: IS1595 family transposase [Candidatus Cybelea sp.]|jgi:transposase-like protein|nr:IS1595 family transposase [Candidatus Cybelea sp.]
METPRTLLEAIVYFSDRKRAHDYFVAVRWPDGIVACPRMGCGDTDVRSIERTVTSRSRKVRPEAPKTWTEYLWFCNGCKKQFTAKVGTLFEDSPIGLDKWLPAVWLLSSDRNGISSYEIGRALKVKQSTAWFMLHRIRTAMSPDNPEALDGIVEADETFIGGKLQFSKRARHAKAGGKWDPDLNKTAVLGAVERGGKARAWAIPDLKRKTMLPKLAEAIHPDSTLFTDGSSVLFSIGREQFSFHDWVNHAASEWVKKGHVHTNNIEGFWSVLRRTLGGTYIHVNPRHLDRYLAEQVFRFNLREEKDGPRFNEALRGADSKRLTYKNLTAKPNRE